ncbi:MAG: type IV toxin-antitoxin system AbiEi family antitoxin [Pseudomonadales bacterium]
MKSETGHLLAREYIEQLASAGRYSFTSKEAKKAFGASTDAVKLALARLSRQGLIAAPARGFYVIVPPEYRSVGSLPADQFIPALMEEKGIAYYAGLLSAAQYYGAAHQRPQEFQVMVSKNRRDIRCGKVRVKFVARKNMARVPVRKFNTQRGQINVSTPEATAIDLAGYPQHVGGLDQVATILSELAEEIDAALLPAAAQTAPLPWAQRLGYLLELAEAEHVVGPLREYIAKEARDYTPLAPSARDEDGPRASAWKIVVNTEVEPDI